MSAGGAVEHKVYQDDSEDASLLVGAHLAKNVMRLKSSLRPRFR
jgi:hypothetical protein